MKKENFGFTLIELLIVVAIIAILAAIAIPNFLAAQTRSKVTRVKGDMRTIITAIESYMVDETVYPLDYGTVAGYPYYLNKCITTPISYISKGGSSGEASGGMGIVRDLFAPQGTTLDPIALRSWGRVESTRYYAWINKGEKCYGCVSVIISRTG
jgi:prepilin-type N-terminal cleavage/methylation domain-containing protein